jgi:hypothetical protein
MEQHWDWISFLKQWIPIEAALIVFLKACNS